MTNFLLQSSSSFPRFLQIGLSPSLWWRPSFHLLLSSTANSIHSYIFTWKPNPQVSNVKCHPQSKHSDLLGLALWKFQGMSLEKLETSNFIKCYLILIMGRNMPYHLYVYTPPFRHFTTFLPMLHNTSDVHTPHQPTIKINLKNLKTNLSRSATIQSSSWLHYFLSWSLKFKYLKLYLCAHTPPLFPPNSISCCHVHLIPHPTSFSFIFLYSLPVDTFISTCIVFVHQVHSSGKLTKY